MTKTSNNKIEEILKKIQKKKNRYSWKGSNSRHDLTPARNKRIFKISKDLRSSGTERDPRIQYLVVSAESEKICIKIWLCHLFEFEKKQGYHISVRDSYMVDDSKFKEEEGISTVILFKIISKEGDKKKLLFNARIDSAETIYPLAKKVFFELRKIAKFKNTTYVNALKKKAIKKVVDPVGLI